MNIFWIDVYACAGSRSGDPAGTNNRENWNKTPLKYGYYVPGPIAVEQSATGRLFYGRHLAGDTKLFAAEWTDADYPVSCLAGGDQTYTTESYKTDETAIEHKPEIELDVQKEMSVKVSPNPSNNTFTFMMNNSEGTEIEIQIEDINGRIIYDVRTAAAQSYKMQWKAEGLTSGVYFYKVLANGNRQTGKLVKY